MAAARKKGNNSVRELMQCAIALGAASRAQVRNRRHNRNGRLQTLSQNATIKITGAVKTPLLPPPEALKELLHRSCDPNTEK